MIPRSTAWFAAADVWATPGMASHRPHRRERQAGGSPSGSNHWTTAVRSPIVKRTSVGGRGPLTRVHDMPTGSAIVLAVVDFDLEEVLELYRAVQWTTYTNNPQVLHAALAGSSRIVVARVGGHLAGLANPVPVHDP